MKKPLNSSSHLALLTRLGGFAAASALLAMSASAVIPNDNDAPGDILDDEVDLTGIGAQLDESGDDCTGTLINPRMVIWAAHCVDDEEPGFYGPRIPIGFAFESNARPGFDSWSERGFRTDRETHVYDVSQVQIHPDFDTFLQADLAIATLDTPVSDVPTWAMLFSPLPAPDEIDPVTGTGYHVDIVGYGRTGNGTDGRESSDRDFKRRAAENMLGALSSDIQYREFRKRSEPSEWPSFKYYLDFDDSAKENENDENRLRDEALRHEGLTTSGDSGGPLILDALNNDITQEDLLLGVLSGSNTKRDTPRNGYGSFSYYQPLFLFWDWIVEANPYRYATTKNEMGDWEDPDHWISVLDPSYRYIDPDGNIVNGIPDRASLGILADGPGFGEFCDDEHPRNYDPDNPDCASAANSDPEFGWWRDEPLPAPTLENGLPGATGFVPDNVDPRPLRGINGRYFDITLKGNSLTRVGAESPTTSILIDKLTLIEGGRLRIFDQADLGTFLGITQFGQGTWVAVDGILGGTGDYDLIQGVVQGTGEIFADALINEAGTIMPGNPIRSALSEALTVYGDVSLRDGAHLMSYVHNGEANRLIVAGDIELGGLVTIPGLHEFGNSYRLIDFGGEATSGFDEVSLRDWASRPLQGVLFAEIEERDNSIFADVMASSLAAHLPGDASGNQLAVGAALDASRDTHLEELRSVYRTVDTLGSGALARTFDGMVPVNTFTTGAALLETGAALDLEVSTRLQSIRQSDAGISLSGHTSMLNARGRNATQNRPLDQIMFGQGSASADVSERTNGIGGFANIAFFDPDTSFGLTETNADMQGYSMTAGIDRALANGAVVGMLASHTRAGTNIGTSVRSTDEQIVGTSFGFYGTMPVLDDYFADAHISFGQLSAQTGRGAPLAGLSETIRGQSSADAVITGVTFGRNYQFENGLSLTPQLGILNAEYQISEYTEQGSVAAFDIEARTLSSTQIRLGTELDWTLGVHDTIRPSLAVSVVNELDAGPDVVQSRFAAAPGAAAITFTGQDRAAYWGELNASIAFDVSPTQSGSFGFRQSVNRGPLTETVVGGSYRIQF